MTFRPGRGNHSQAQQPAMNYAQFFHPSGSQSQQYRRPGDPAWQHTEYFRNGTSATWGPFDPEPVAPAGAFREQLQVVDQARVDMNIVRPHIIPPANHGINGPSHGQGGPVAYGDGHPAQILPYMSLGRASYPDGRHVYGSPPHFGGPGTVPMQPVMGPVMTSYPGAFAGGGQPLVGGSAVAGTPYASGPARAPPMSTGPRIASGLSEGAASMRGGKSRVRGAGVRTNVAGDRSQLGSSRAPQAHEDSVTFPAIARSNPPAGVNPLTMNPVVQVPPMVAEARRNPSISTTPYAKGKGSVGWTPPPTAGGDPRISPYSAAYVPFAYAPTPPLPFTYPYPPPRLRPSYTPVNPTPYADDPGRSAWTANPGAPLRMLGRAQASASTPPTLSPPQLSGLRLRDMGTAASSGFDLPPPTGRRFQSMERARRPAPINTDMNVAPKSQSRFQAHFPARAQAPAQNRSRGSFPVPYQGQSQVPFQFPTPPQAQLQPERKSEPPPQSPDVPSAPERARPRFPKDAPRFLNVFESSTEGSQEGEDEESQAGPSTRPGSVQSKKSVQTDPGFGRTPGRGGKPGRSRGANMEK
ncbi:MAG: hypothetical protein M1838_003344 [Thelocarpon superellum]|nr:MAG: hypothetical protein M1838_003344 [Thelocarpon superellum]